MSWRLRSVRTRILLLALVPVLSLFGLYVFTTSITARDALILAHAATVKNVTGQPAGAFLAALDTERPLAMVYLADPISANLTRLKLQGTRTSRAAAAFRAVLTSSSTMDSASTPEKQAIATLLRDIRNLPALRAQVVSGAVSRSTAFAAYNGLVGDTYLMLNQAIRQETNAPLVAQGLAFVRMGRAEEMLLQEDALLVSDMVARSFPAADRQQFTELVGARRTLLSLTLPDLDPPYRAIYTRGINPQAYAALVLLENHIIAGSRPGRLPPVRPAAWGQAVGGVFAGLTRAGKQASDVLVQQASNVAFATNLRVFVTGGIGLLLVLLSLIVAILTSRSLVRELTGLRQSALDLATKRLPEVVDRLASGQRVDVSAEAPDIPASSDEIGQVRDAFATVQRTAVQAAVAQARLRQGMSDVFRNLARRSQSLLHRQLTLLDAMERRARDPQELEDLFRIDHLTTRMRRHAESLIILSGHTPARGWRNPVPLVDVLRAAVAEVEDYTRIKATAGTQAALAGPAVGDVIHLIAELAENATMYSPPNTPVTIHGDTVGQGFAVEIEDRGLGLSDEQLAWINELLENPPPFDPSNSDQLGLFVAGQLAKRHNIKVSMRPSPYGGTTAIMLIPRTLVVTEADQATDLSLAGAPSSGPRLQRRHATWGWAGAARDADTGPLALAPSAAPSPWPAVEVPAMRDPGDAAGPGMPDLDVTSLARPGVETADPETAGLGVGNPGPGSLGPGNFGPGGFGPGGLGAGDLDTGDLPRRVRQASLAPQLRESTLDPVPPPGAGDFAPPAPEEARSTMTAIQHGWERGRSIFDAPAGHRPGPENGETAPAGADPAGDGGTPGGAGTPEGTGTTQAAETPEDTPDTGTTAPVSAAVPAGDTGTAGTQSGEEPAEDGGWSG